MRRTYGGLFAAVVVLALALTAFGRPRTHGPASPVSARVAPAVELAIAITDGQVSPAVAAVPKESRVRLRVDYRGSKPARFALAGYEDRVSIELSPDVIWEGEFLADRPGDDFAWLLDGQPVGRLNVTGSHLAEDHR